MSLVLRRKVMGLRYEGYFFDAAGYEASTADIAALRTIGTLGNPGTSGAAARWQCRIPEHTLIVPLAPSEEEIAARFEARARASIRNAERNVKVTWAGAPGERSEFYRAYRDFAARRGLLLPDPAEEGGLDILLARDREGRLLQAAAFLPVPAAGVYRYRYGVSIRKTQANAGILFEAVRRAKALGYARFDLGGIVPGARPGSPEAGINFFKSQFAGEEVVGHLFLRGRTALLRGLLRGLQAAVPLKPALDALRGLASRKAAPEAGPDGPSEDPS